VHEVVVVQAVLDCDSTACRDQCITAWYSYCCNGSTKLWAERGAVVSGVDGRNLLLSNRPSVACVGESLARSSTAGDVCEDCAAQALSQDSHCIKYFTGDRVAADRCAGGSRRRCDFCRNRIAKLNGRDHEACLRHVIARVAGHPVSGVDKGCHGSLLINLVYSEAP